MITPILPNMIPMRDIKQISDGDRLFYELGHIRGLDLEDDDGNSIGEIRFSGIKWQLLSQYRDDKLRGLYI